MSQKLFSLFLLRNPFSPDTLLSAGYLFIRLSNYQGSQMKANVAGVRRMAGTAKTSGNAYDMCTITLLVPVEQVNSPKMQINGAGFNTMEMPLDVEALPVFMSQKFPCTLDLDTDVRPRAGKPETVVVGIRAIKAAA